MQTRREAMVGRLRSDCRTGRLRAGGLVPSVRELGEQHGLSKNVVHAALRDLIGEGLLHSVPGVGTFVGPPPASFASKGTEYFLLLQDYSVPPDRRRAIERGFTEEISSHGDATLTLELDTALRMPAPKAGAPSIAGICGYVPQEMLDSWGLSDTLPLAQFFPYAGVPERTDVVSFDDVAGGRMATQHLLTLGHKKIAFLGLHTTTPHDVWRWSQERMIGWSEVLRSAGLPTEGLAFLAERALKATEEVTAAAVEIAERGLAARRDITAVVACNDSAALGLIEALCRARVPEDEWPAIVGFDNLPLIGGRLLTSLSLSFEDVGRAGARLLWQRRHGLLVGPPVHELVPMKLLPRLSSTAGWSAQFDFAPILLASRAQSGVAVPAGARNAPS